MSKPYKSDKPKEAQPLPKIEQCPSCKSKAIRIEGGEIICPDCGLEAIIAGGI